MYIGRQQILLSQILWMCVTKELLLSWIYTHSNRNGLLYFDVTVLASTFSVLAVWLRRFSKRITYPGINITCDSIIVQIKWNLASSAIFVGMDIYFKSEIVSAIIFVARCAAKQAWPVSCLTIAQPVITSGSQWCDCGVNYSKWDVYREMQSTEHSTITSKLKSVNLTITLLGIIIW